MEKNLWIIQLHPAFELIDTKEGNNINPEISGIYRYKNSSDEIVYIGRGKIKSRLKSDERKDWDFSTIEYSVVENEEDREKWEAYWIIRFKEENGGRLPYYNNVSGSEKYL